jgi:hypothetical protein
VVGRWGMSPLCKLRLECAVYGVCRLVCAVYCCVWWVRKGLRRLGRNFRGMEAVRATRGLRSWKGKGKCRCVETW